MFQLLPPFVVFQIFDCEAQNPVFASANSPSVITLFNTGVVDWLTQVIPPFVVLDTIAGGPKGYPPNIQPVFSSTKSS